MPGLVATGASKTTQEMIAQLHAKISAALPKLAEALAAHVASKAPTPEEEYEAIMVGDGGGEYSPPPLAGNQSSDDPSTGRIRFLKEPGTFLQDLAVRPENIWITQDFVSIGNLAFLMEKSVFSFKDFVPTRPRPGASYPTQFFQSQSYFEAFEYGTADGSGWTGEVGAEGTWRLRPDDVNRDWTDLPRTMSKPIYARLMYFPGDLDMISREFLNGILASR